MRPLWVASLLLGAGLGGLLDVVVLHGLLQWHHVVDVGAPDDGPTAVEVRLDAAFMLGALALVAAGVVRLWRCWSLPGVVRDTRVLAGGMLAGWGLFNVLDGLVDHHVLRLHHVHPSGALGWDLAFLAVSAGLCGAGVLLAATAPSLRDAGQPAAAPPPAARPPAP